MADDFRDLNLGELFRNYNPYGEGGELTPEGEAAPEVPPEGTSESENRGPRSLNEKEVKVRGIWGTQDPNNPDGPPKQTFVLLRDNRGRRVPIFIGQFETRAIQMALEGVTPERPLTHDLLKISIEKLGGKVDRITIDDLWQGTFYARVTIARGEEMIDIDCRPSDAIALAVSTRAPIYMAEEVIETAEQEDD